MSPHPQPAPQPVPAAAKSLAGGLEARLLAEAVRIHEQSAGPRADAAAAEAVARAAGGGLEQRILVRAQALDRDHEIAAALSHMRAVARLVIAGMIAFAAIAGAGAAQAAMGLGGRNLVNFFVVLVVALGPATAMLLAWLALVLLGSAHAAGIIGRLAAGLAERLVRLSHRDASHLAALRAFGRVMASSAYGRWTLAAVTHGAWLGFLVALLLVVLLLLSTRSYVFVWETTILSAETYVPLTRWMAAGPALLGFAGPTPAEIAASQWLGSGSQPAIARDAWAELLVGCILFYGILPRLALLVLSLLLRARAAGRFRLDTSLPGYAQLASRLMPVSAPMGYADSDSGTEPVRGPGQRVDEARVQPDPAGPIAVLGLELDAPASGWPPPLGDTAVLDLGRIQGRQDLRDALDRLRASTPAPRLLVVFGALIRTPDRGILAYLDAIAAASAIPIRLVLTGGQHLRQRLSGDGVETRLRDWHALAQRAGIDAGSTIEIDLDNLTHQSRARLREIAGAAATTRGGEDRLGRAFAILRAESARWVAAPDLEVQAELHRKIARLYDEETGWKRWFDLPDPAAPDLTLRMKAASDKLVALLPRHLGLDPRWLTAGAAAGALGCVAVATLAVPVAISGLPLWAGLGAAVAAAMRSGPGDRGEASSPPQADRGAAVRAAALFAILLDSQGRGEAAITRLLDAAIGEEQPELATDAEIAAWLDRVRQRYREALAREEDGR